MVTLRGAPGGTGSGRPNLYVDGVLQRDDQQWLFERPDGQRPAHHWDLPVEEIQSVRVVLGAAGGQWLALGAHRRAVLVTTRRARAGDWSSRLRVQGNATAAGATPQAVTTRTGSYNGGVTNICTIFIEATGRCTPTSSARLVPYAGANPFESATGGRAAFTAAGGLLGGAARVGVVGDASTGALGERVQRIDAATSLQREFGARTSIDVDLRAARSELPYYGSQLIQRIGGEARIGADSGLGVTPLPVSMLIDIARQDHVVDRLQGRVGANLRVGARDSLYVSVRREQLSRTIEHDVAGRFALDHATTSASLGYRASRKLSASTRLGLRAEATQHRSDATETQSGGELALKSELTAYNVGVGLEQLGRRSLDAGVRVEEWGPGADIRSDDSPLAFASARWRISDEPWMPGVPLLPRVTLGFAYGESSDLQAQEDASFEAINGNVLGISTERALEREWSFEASSASGSVALVGRIFGRRLSGSYLLTPISVSSGFAQLLWPGAGLKTSGGELALRLQRALPSGAAASASLWLASSESHFTNSPPDGASTTDWSWMDFGFGPGERYGAVRELRLPFADTSGDGVLQPGELGVATYGRSWSSMPTHTAGATLAVQRLRGWDLGMTLDAKFGHRRFDAETIARCSRRLCDEVYDPSLPLARQAEILSFRAVPHDAAFLRVRELWLRRELGGAIRVSVIGRQLLTLTRYPGRDPEVTAFLQPGIAIGDEFQQPLRPSLELRLDIGGF